LVKRADIFSPHLAMTKKQNKIKKQEKQIVGKQLIVDRKAPRYNFPANTLRYAIQYTPIAAESSAAVIK